MPRWHVNCSDESGNHVAPERLTLHDSELDFLQCLHGDLAVLVCSGGMGVIIY